MIREYTTRLDPHYNAWRLLAEKGYQITAEQAVRLLNSKDANLVGILDFRTKAQEGDMWDLKIRGSVNYPIDGLSPELIKLGEVVEPKDKSRENHEKCVISFPLIAI